MKTIQLLTPALESLTEELQAFQWPGESETTPNSSEQTRPAGGAFRWDALEVVSGDRTAPRPVHFTWEDVQPRPPNTVYDLHISKDSTFEDSIVFRDIAEPCRLVVNLRIGTRYFWKVIARDGDSELALSEVWAFATHPSTPRWIHVPGMTNIRDMGGWRLPGNRCIRQGLIYRSSEMNNHVNVTDEGKKVLIEELNIRTDLDLRGAGGDDDPKEVLDPNMVKWVQIPISPYDNIVSDKYREGYRKIFALFADPSNCPIIFHCYGGCDRGGTVSFLLHALLGLDKDSLIRDYELSSLTIWGERSHLSEEFQSLLSALRPFGDETDDIGKQVENYLLSIGVTAEEIMSVRTHLIGETDLR